MDQRSVKRTGSGEPASRPEPQTGTLLDLLRRLTEQLSTLFRQEVRLAGAELAGSLARLLASAVSVVSGSAVLYAGFLLLLFAAVVGLANLIPLWLASLSVGGVVALVGYLLLLTGKNKLNVAELAPTHSAASLQRDKDILTRKGP